MKQKLDSKPTSKPDSNPASAPSDAQTIDGSHLAGLSWTEQVKEAAKLLGVEPSELKVRMTPPPGHFPAKPVVETGCVEL